MKMSSYVTIVFAFLAGLSSSLGLTQAKSSFTDGFLFGLSTLCCLVLLLGILLIVILVIILLIKKILD